MRRFHSFPRYAVSRGLVLGFSGLVLNALTYTYFSESVFRPGDFFLFLAAASMGGKATLVALGTALIPEIIYSIPEAIHLNDVFVDPLRISVLCLIVSFTSNNYPKIPYYIFGLLFWLLVYTPIIIILGAHNVLQSHLEIHRLLLEGFGEILLLMIAGTLLLTPTVWKFLTAQGRTVPASLFSMHIFASIATVLMFLIAGILISPNHTNFASALENSDALSLVFVFIGGIGFASYMGHRIASITKQELIESSATLAGHKTFSGLSSDFWRRKTNATEGVLTSQLTARLDSLNTSQTEILGTGIAESISSDRGICALNRNGTITFLNRKFRSYTSITMNDIVGKNIEAIGMNPVILKHVLNLLEYTFENGQKVTEIKLNQLPDKLRFFEIASMRSDAFENSALADGPDSIIITLKDITERRTIESHLLKAQKLESLGSIVSKIAHAFTNALTSISAEASFAQYKNDPEILSSSVNEIISLTRNAGKIVQQLLEFASDQPNLMHVQSLNTLIGDRLEFFQKSIGEDMVLKYETCEDELFVLLENNLLIQAITNVLLNSKQSYPNQTGDILITLDKEEIDEEITQLNPGARKGSFARLRIKDFGVGMTQETLEKAFDPLFTTKSLSGHTGLGLSTVFAIVRAHDGFLAAESYPEKGSTISIYLPLKEKPMENANQNKAQSLKESANKESTLPKKIAVVEDDNDVRELIRKILTAVGYEVTSFSSVEEALSNPVLSSYDLVLVDIIMPRISGYDFLAKVKEINPSVRTLAMSGALISNDSRQDIEINGIIQKPFDFETLTNSVKHALLN